MPSDPDRFFQFSTPGAQEWWYFDAISDDGRDALVIVWYAGLPFDPDYGVGSLRHLKDPGRYQAPRALDHCAIGLSWYRDGKTAAYALNGYRRGDFLHQAGPFAVEVGGSRLDREGGEYRLRVATPTVDGRGQIAAALRFVPASATEPFEVDLGGPDSPHHWVLAAADCRVEGRLAVAGPRPASLEFRGRGYHDHNAGSEEMSRAMRRWIWGRFHEGPDAEVFYRAEPHAGPSRSLWITCRDGRPHAVREGVAIEERSPRRNAFGVRSAGELRVGGVEGFACVPSACVDDGPFYRRWVARGGRSGAAKGISELLDTRNLNRALFNWMIPYRLKRPRG